MVGGALDEVSCPLAHSSLLAAAHFRSLVSAGEVGLCVCVHMCADVCVCVLAWM